MSKAKRYIPDGISLKYTQGTLLYLFLIPLFLAIVLALFKTDIKAFFLNGVAFALFYLTANLAKKGFRQESVYRSSVFTKAPEIPFKKYAAYLLGIATFFTALVPGEKSFIISLFLALIATLGYYMFYGFDPKEDKTKNIGGVSAEFVIETIDEAKSKIIGIEDDMREIHDNILHDKLQVAIEKSELILQTIQEDPKDIRVARKFLVVYLDGVANVTDSYTALEEDKIDKETKQRLHELMDDVEQKFDKELERLKSNNEFDLDVHIDVLKEQIK